MVAPKGSRLNLAFGLPSPPPAGTGLVLDFSDAQPPLGYVGGAYDGAMGVPSVRFRARVLRPKSIGDIGAVGLLTIEKEAQRVFAQGWQSGGISTPKYVSWRRFVTPLPMAEPKAPAMPSLRLAGGYQPAPGSNIILNFAEPLQPPPGEAVVLEFGAMGYGRVLGATVGDASAYGNASLARPDSLRPSGIAPPNFGRPTLELGIRTIFVGGFNAQAFGTQHLRLGARPLLPPSFVAQAFGTPQVWNWWQFVYPRQFLASNTGSPSLLGGKKELLPSGIGAPELGRPAVVNTRADQYIRPSGFTHYAMGAPVVSPRFLRPGGILGTLFGTPLVQKHPVTIGWDSLVWGVPTVYDRTKYVKLAGIAPADPQLGYPVVRDRAQKVFHLASPITTVFGDVVAWNVTKSIHPAGIESAEFGVWHAVQNTLRYLQVQAVPSGAIGAAVIYNKTPAIRVVGWESLTFGASAIGHWFQHSYPIGIHPPEWQVSRPVVDRTPTLYPTGISPDAIERPTVWLSARTVEAEGFDASIFGRAMAAPDPRYLSLQNALGIAGEEHGEPRVEFLVRAIELRGPDFASIGTVAVEAANKVVRPEGIDFHQIGPGHLVGTHRTIAPAGFVATRWLTRIIPEMQSLQGHGAEQGVLGEPSIELWRRYIPVRSIAQHEAQLQFGVASLYHLRRYIVQFGDDASGLAPPQWVGWTSIANRNRTVGPTSWDSQRFGYQGVENAARPVYPPSVPVAEPGSGFISYYVRYLQPPSIEASHLTRWLVVFNGAKVLGPQGITATSFGQHDLLNTRRFRQLLGFDAMQLGSPWVSDHTRAITFASFGQIPAPSMAMPYVGLYTRYVEPRTVGDALATGMPLLNTRVNRITPRWAHYADRFGYPVLKNLTPEVLMWGWDSGTFGDALVRLQWRPVYGQGENHALFGRAIIADRTKVIWAQQIASPGIGPRVTVARTGIEPPHTKSIVLSKFSNPIGMEPPEVLDEGYGIDAARYGHGKLEYGMRHSFPEAFDSQQFGQARIRAGDIRVIGMYKSDKFGQPQLAHLLREIKAPSLGQLVQDLGSYTTYQGGHGSWGLPSISPHTIYPVIDAPNQAKKNHFEWRRPAGFEGQWPPSPSEGIVIGKHSVQNLHRAIIPESIAGDLKDVFAEKWGVGEPSLETRLFNLQVPGRNQGVFGLPMIPYSKQYVDCYSTGFDAVTWGPLTMLRHAYSNEEGTSEGPTDRAVTPHWVRTDDYGKPSVDHFHRAVLAESNDYLQMGSSDWGFSRLPQRLWVGFPIENPIEGFDASSVSEAASVSNWVRELLAQGFNTFASEYDEQMFGARMRVTKTGQSRPAPRRIGPHGISSMARVATPGARNHRYVVRPDAIHQDNYRQGAQEVAHAD